MREFDLFNKLAWITPDLFDKLGNLQLLFLHSNMITSLDDGVFAGLVSLKRLALDDNQLAMIGKDVFKPLARLNVLSLNRNKLTDLDKNVFEGLVSLALVEIENNPIQADRPGYVASLCNETDNPVCHIIP